jgi:hypothetical protein
MHPLIGLAMLIGLGAFIVFAFRQGTRVPKSGRSDDQAAVNMLGSESGSSHHADFGGPGHS